MEDIYCYEYAYDSYYCYQNSNILRNKFNYTSLEELSDVERSFSALRTEQLLTTIDVKEIVFDAELLKYIHHYIFQDIYDWSGEYRKVDIAKGNMFCRSTFIPEQVDQYMNSLAHEDFLTNLDINGTAIRLAHYMGELNAIHPFREGNGRTQRIFIKLLALKNGFDIDYSTISSEEMLEASILSFDLDYSLMESIMIKAIHENE